MYKNGGGWHGLLHSHRYITMARIMITSTLVLAALYHAATATETKAAKVTTTTKATSTPAPTATGTTTVQYIHPHSAPNQASASPYIARARR
jgi:hypothetical protein